MYIKTNLKQFFTGIILQWKASDWNEIYLHFGNFIGMAQEKS